MKKAIVVGLGLVLTASAAVAALPIGTPERELDMRIEAAPVEDLLFLFRYALHPACKPERRHWTDGVGDGIWYLADGLQSTGDLQARRDLLGKRFNVEKFELVVISTRPGSPAGLAGLIAGDVVAPAVPSPPLPQPATTTEVRAEIARRATEADARLSTNPVVQWKVRRGGQIQLVPVRKVRACSMRLLPVDSQHAYADAERDKVIITVPLMKNTTTEELKAVLAHEAAHVALGHSDNRARARQGVFGNASIFGENAETGLLPYSDAEMIAADLLAMRLLEPAGISPEAYAATMRKLNGNPSMRDGPFYWRTHPLQRDREAQLTASAKQWAAARSLVDPPEVTPEVLTAVSERMREALQQPQRTFGPGEVPAAKP